MQYGNDTVKMQIFNVFILLFQQRRNIYIFYLANSKRFVYLHPTLREPLIPKRNKRFFQKIKRYYNEQKNISAIEKKKKKQTRF